MSNEEESTLNAWKRLVFDKSEFIDPGYEHDWRSLFIGFCLSRDLSIDDAEDLYYTALHEGFV